MNIILMQLSPESIAQAIKAADALSEKNDRWLFLFTLILFLVCGYFVIRYMIAAVEKLQAKNEENSAKFSETILTMLGNEHRLHADFSVKLHSNTLAMEKNTEALTHNASVISDLRKKTDNLTEVLLRTQGAR